jgi:hypothetical protein
MFYLISLPVSCIVLISGNYRYIINFNLNEEFGLT